MSQPSAVLVHSRSIRPAAAHGSMASAQRTPASMRSASRRTGEGRRPSVHVRSVEDRRLSVRLPGHEHEARPELRIDHGQRATRSENGNLRAAHPPCVGTEAGLAFQHVHEAVEVGRDQAAEGSAPRQLDVQDEPRSPEFDRRAVPYQHPDGRVSLLPDGHVLRIQDLRARLDSLALARQVHPKEDAAHLAAGLALPELVFADPFRVPHAAARSELQERSGLQPRALHRATWTGAVAGTGLARDQVPQVVEPTVRVLGVHARPLRSDGNDALMDEDEGVYLRIRDGPRWQWFEDIEAHHRANVGVLDQDDLPLTGLDLRGHGFCSFRSARTVVAEGLVLRPSTAAEGCTDLAHAPRGHVDAQISAQVYRSVGDDLYPGRLLGLLTRTLLQPVVQRAARAATHDLGHLLRGRARRSAGNALCRRRLSRPGRCMAARGRSPILYLREASGS